MNEELPLAPCKLCGSEAYEHEAIGAVRMECFATNCGVAGPWADSREKAITGWNTLNEDSRAVGWRAAIGECRASLAVWTQNLDSRHEASLLRIFEEAIAHLEEFDAPATWPADPRDEMIKRLREALHAFGDEHGPFRLVPRQALGIVAPSPDLAKARAALGESA